MNPRNTTLNTPESHLAIYGFLTLWCIMGNLCFQHFPSSAVTLLYDVLTVELRLELGLVTYNYA